MTSKPSKTSLLSDKLEFEDVTKPSTGSDLDLPEEIKQAIAAEEAQLQAQANADPVAPAPIASPLKPAAPVKPAPVKSAPVQKNPVSEKDEISDKFALRAALLALISLIVILTSTFVYKKVLRDDNLPGYVVLPQGVANIDGQIIRMQITIQVKDADKEWLIENKRILSDLFQIELAKLDLKELRTEQELEEARLRMRDNLNAAMATDKIEAVLINEFLSQNKD